jgi:hypothetical protein
MRYEINNPTVTLNNNNNNNNKNNNIKIKVKESRNRPGVAQRVPGDLGSQISMIFGT